MGKYTDIATNNNTPPNAAVKIGSTVDDSFFIEYVSSLSMNVVILVNDVLNFQLFHT